MVERKVGLMGEKKVERMVVALVEMLVASKVR
jgi:hypothetical protein